ncbi:MAG: FecR domain-containing protein [Cellvibrionaceae bacterium]
MKPTIFTSALAGLVLLLSTPAFSAEWLYTFRPGDTIWDLCLKYTNQRGCWLKLPPLNGVKNDRYIKPGFVLSFPAEWLKEIPKPVAVTFVDGEAFVLAMNSQTPVAIKKGDQLGIGATLTTAASATLNLKFGDGSTLQMEPNSELSLDTLSSFDGYGVVDSRLRLNQGAVKTRVVKRRPASRFRITTPSAVAAVRGTEYRVSSIDGPSPIMRGEVFEGLVDVNTDQNKQAVPAGFGITAKKGEALKAPKPLLPAPSFSSASTPQLLPIAVEWKAVDGATSYQLELLKNNQNDELISRSTLSETRFSFTELDLGCYKTRLRAIDSEELQGLAGEQTLCVAAPLAIANLDPQNLNFSDRFNATLSWPIIDDAARYRVQVARDVQFSEILSDEIVTQTQITLSGKAALYVRIQTIGHEGQVTAFSPAMEWKPKPNPWIAIGLYALFAIIAF